MEPTNSEAAPPLPPPSNFKYSSLPATDNVAGDEPSVDLYTIPGHSCWFSWDSIHDTERVELREFFDGSSFTRTPKVYKEYRDFIISKYREDPSRRLTFTDVRKSLVGDVCMLRKVFNFLDKWGLINFSAPPAPVPEPWNDGPRVRVEEGAPVGVRVVATPNSSKPLVVPPVAGGLGGGAGGVGGGGGGDNGFKLPPLASYSDVFRETGGEKEVSCGNCQEKCDSKYYECTKEKCVLCSKCFEKGIHGENKAKDDFKLNDTFKSSGSQGTVWTEAETLLLLESVLKHGDDWELVAQNVQTKTKLECISRLIELPFGELMLGSHGKVSARGIIDEANAIQQQKASGEPKEPVSSEPEEQKESIEAKEQNDSSEPKEQKDSSEPQATKKVEDDHQQENDVHQEKDHQEEIVQREKSMEIQSLEPPTKKKRVDSSDPSRSLMEQVALISTMVGPEITAVAASAAVSALSEGNPLVRDIFYSEDDLSEFERRSGNLNNELESAVQSEDKEMKDASHSSEVDKTLAVQNSIPLGLRMRAAVATALGAAAAHARLLAEQEEREIEHLMAFIIDTQMKKLKRKAKYLEELECLMEKEHILLDESKGSIIGERIDTLQRIFASGIPRWKDHSSLRPPYGGA